MVDEETWTGWRDQIAQSKTLTELRRKLLARAEQLGTLLIGLKQERAERSPNARLRRLDEWKLLGVDAKVAAMESSGASRFGQSQRLVLVREDDPPQRQRFTVAHEIGHYFLSRSELASSRVTHSQEEALCDEFASKLLLPPAELAAELKSFGANPSITDILSLCKGFGVGLQPMLIALRGQLNERAPIFVAASYRGHRLRPDVLDFRVDASAHPRSLYVAKDQRLSSLGLAAVTEWASTQKSSGRGQGTAPSLRLKLWDRERHQSGTATGPADWEATRLRNGSVLLVRVAPHDLSLTWTSVRVESDGRARSEA